MRSIGKVTTLLVDEMVCLLARWTDPFSMTVIRGLLARWVQVNPFKM